MMPFITMDREEFRKMYLNARLNMKQETGAITEAVEIPVLATHVTCGNCGIEIEIKAENITDLHYHLSWRCEKKNDEKI